MGRSKRVGIALIVFFSACLLHAQQSIDQTEPAWLLLERGKKAYDEGEFGLAIRLFRAAVERQGIFPEAEFWIGSVFEAEGEYAIAELQYERAYELRSALGVPSEAYAILYRLATIYEVTGRYLQFEEVLTRVLAGPFPDDRPDAPRPDVLYRVLLNQGIDKLLELFRIDDAAALQGYANLGVFQCRTGRYQTAAFNLSYAVTTTLTRIVEHLLEADPDYRYLGVARLLEDLRRSRLLTEYAQTADLYRQLYFLGASLFGDGKLAAAREIWTLVADSGFYDRWAARAAAQLESPETEPLIELPPA